MSWTDIFPVLDEDLVEEFLVDAPERERQECLDHVVVAERFNPQDNKPEVSYSPILGGQLGARGGLIDPATLAAAFIWHRQRGSIAGNAELPGCASKPLKGACWPEYGFDELFLKVAVYSRLVKHRMLTFVPTSARSMLLPVDVEYTIWGNSQSEIIHFPSGLPCGLQDDAECIERSEYGKHVFNLDADNTVSARNFAVLVQTAAEHQPYVAHQPSNRTWDGSYGRVLLPAWLYRRTPGYHVDLRHYGADDQMLMVEAMRHDGVALLSLPYHGLPGVLHGNEERMGLRAGHIPGMSLNDHMRAAAENLDRHPSASLESVEVQVWDQTGSRLTKVKHGGWA
ncbi:MAG TPA: hypothetical protein VMN36_03500 [Verrucomicrobiales bacterium]|nr:hypothetical protein [Verrucomicrobiales bacterium]